MEYIRSKDLYLLMSDALRQIDARVIDHGAKTAYIMCKMLERKGGYEAYEIADFGILATLHDIGAYRTDLIDEMLRVECRDYIPHSVYGYLFFKYLSPHEEFSKILLYHHLDYSSLKNSDYAYFPVACYLNFAEKIVIYDSALGDKFDYHKFEQYKGTRFMPEAYDIFDQLVQQENILQKLQNNEYQQELDAIMDYTMLSDDEKYGYLKMLMYSMSFRSASLTTRTVATINICREIGKIATLGNVAMVNLFFASMLYDIGMLSVPKKLIERQASLTEKPPEQVRLHVDMTEKLLRGRLPEEVTNIIVKHHEKPDGSGYPKGDTAENMNRLQRILQTADTVAGMMKAGNYQDASQKTRMVQILKDEAKHGRLDNDTVDLFCGFYDTIMEVAGRESEQILQMLTRLDQQYETVCRNFRQ